MEEAVTGSPVSRRLLFDRCAIVSGANKGIGFATCKLLAAKGIMVVLTARDERRGNEALERLKDFGGGISSSVVFHQLDVMDPTSIACLVDFIRSKFGKLDILVNNAGFLGVGGDVSAVKPKLIGISMKYKYLGENGVDKEAIQTEEKGIYIENYELAERCLQTNYYGSKRMTEAFIPLLQLSNSPRIINVSSIVGKLGAVSNGWATKVLSDAESLTEERVDEVVNKFLEDFKEGSVEEKGWVTPIPAYRVSKAALNAYTRVIAKKFPNIITNCLCPGHAQTDMSCNTGPLTAEEAAEGLVKLALLPHRGPSGSFFVNRELSSF